MLISAPTLTTERLTLRAPAPRDAEAYIAFHGSERAKYVGGAMTRARAWEAFGTELGHWLIRGFGMFTVTWKTDDRALGMVGHWCPDGWPEQEVGWELFEAENEGKGIAFEAAQACIAHAWGPLGWSSVVSYVGHGNLRSAALAKRLGARLDPEAPVPNPEKPWGAAYRHPKPKDLQ